MIDRETIVLAERAGLDLGKGYVRKTDGRAVVWYAEAFPGALKSGPRTALRSRIVWWLHTGEVLRGCEFNLHHKNRDRTDDRIANLEKVLHAEHSLEHNPIGRADRERTCRFCSSTFLIKAWRLKENSRGSYCSQRCYHSADRSAITREKQRAGLKKAYAEGRR